MLFGCQGKVLVNQENEYIKGDLNPTFKPFKIHAQKDDILKITCYDHDFKCDPDIIGIAKLEVITRLCFCRVLRQVDTPFDTSVQVSDIAAGKEIDLSDYKERPESEMAKYK